MTTKILVLLLMALAAVPRAVADTVIPPPSDSDGHPITRMKYAPTGWTYQQRMIEYETCVLGSVYSKDHANADTGDVTLKLYDGSGTELTTQGAADTDCVRTQVDWEPSHNYEVVGGSIVTLGSLTDNLRAWVVAVPDLTAEQGGSKVFVQGINLLFLDAKRFRNIDGRTSKHLTYNATYHTNKLRTVIRSVAGAKHRLMQAFEIFKN